MCKINILCVVSLWKFIGRKIRLASWPDAVAQDSRQNRSADPVSRALRGLQPFPERGPRAAVIHTFRGNHDATVVRFGYQVRRNGQESRCRRRDFARRFLGNARRFLGNTRDVSGVRGIRDSRSARRPIFSAARGWFAKGDVWGIRGASFTQAAAPSGSMAPHRAARQFYGVRYRLSTQPVYRSVRYLFTPEKSSCVLSLMSGRSVSCYPVDFVQRDLFSFNRRDKYLRESVLDNAVFF